MIVLKATEEQYQELNGYRNEMFHIQFTKDADGNWVLPTEVLKLKQYKEIHYQLNELERIEYIPIPDPIEEEI